ncbi:hypothetical protein U9M48_009855 [Paspalum notatum var. saurae]|uniref:CCHC-type domain-containing protein n=1 Tax=Paspalum notatum var. saurae TaxID=547442 RepID=A0AAQ3STP9_PASNO
MDSRSGAAAPGGGGAPAALPQYPLALLTLPDLERPPAIMEMWEMEAVAAALPAKKRRLRETFDRLAACSPTPLPFRWEDLDTYISSLQYPVTLSHRQRREQEKSRPAPLAPALALPAISVPPAAGGGDDVSQVRVPENSRLVPAPAPTPPAVFEVPSAGGDAHMIRALEKYSEPDQAPAPTSAAVSAPAVTGVDNNMVKGTKRKASSQEAEEVHVATRLQEGLADTRKIHEDAIVRKKASPLKDDVNGSGKWLMHVPLPPGDDNVLAPDANAITETTPQVDPVSNIAIVQQEIAGAELAAARHGSNATNGAEAGVPKFTCLHLQRKRPTRPAVQASAAVPRVTGSPKAANQKMQKLDDAVERMPQVERHDDLVAAKNTSHKGRMAKVSPLRPDHAAGNGLPVTAVAARVDADPIRKVGGGGIGHEPPAANVTSQAISPPKVDSFSPAKPPQQERSRVEEAPAPHVKMEVVEPEETQVLENDAPPVAAEKASPWKQVWAPAAANKVSRPLSPGCRSGLAQAGARAATTVPVDAAGVAAVTLDAPNLVEAGAPKSAGVAAATRDGGPDATRLAPAGSQGARNASAVIPPRRGSGEDCAAATRRGLNATDPVPDCRRRREAAGGPSPSQSKAYPNASNNHVLQQQHMSKKGGYREPISSPAQKHKECFSRSRNDNHGGGSRPVPEAQAAAAAAAAQGPWNKSGEGRPRAATARGLQGDDDRGYKKSNGRGQSSLRCNRCGCRGHLAEDCRTKFCSKCGFRGHLAEDCRTRLCSKCGSKVHLAETCRTEEHLVVLYQKHKEEQICYRCGSKGHWSRTCRTEKHLVDLYQKDRAAKRAASTTGLAPEASRMNTNEFLNEFII